MAQEALKWNKKALIITQHASKLESNRRNRLTISVEIPLPDHNADENNRYTDEDHYHNEDQSVDIGNDPWFRKWRPGFGFGATGTAIDARTNAAGILYAEHI